MKKAKFLLTIPLLLLLSGCAVTATVDTVTVITRTVDLDRQQSIEEMRETMTVTIKTGDGTNLIGESFVNNSSSNDLETFAVKYNIPFQLNNGFAFISMYDKENNFISKGQVEVVQNGDSVVLKNPELASQQFNGFTGVSYLKVSYETRFAVSERTYRHRQINLNGEKLAESGEWMEAPFNCPAGRICQIQ